MYFVSGELLASLLGNVDKNDFSLLELLFRHVQSILCSAHII